MTTRKYNRNYWKSAEQQAARGELSPPPDFSAKTHERYRTKLKEVTELAKRGDIEGLKSFPINPNSTSPKAINKYRNLCIEALEAKMSNGATSAESSEMKGIIEGIIKVVVEEAVKAAEEAMKTAVPIVMRKAEEAVKAAVPIVQQRATEGAIATVEGGRVAARHIGDAAQGIAARVSKIIRGSAPAQGCSNHLPEPSTPPEGEIPNTRTSPPMKLEVKRIGNSDGFILPRELMQRLDINRGQSFHVTELAGGGLQLLPYDPDFEATMEAADEIMDEYRDTLATLAK